MARDPAYITVMNSLTEAGFYLEEAPIQGDTVCV